MESGERRSGSHPLREGAALGDVYRVEATLGGCAWQTTYLVRHERLGVSFEARVYHGDAYREGAQGQALRGRALAQGRLGHGHVRTVRDVFEVDGGGALAVVCERLEGETLGALLERGEVLDEARAVEMALGVLDALVLAHRRHTPHLGLSAGWVVLVWDAPDRARAVVDGFGVTPLLPGDGAGAGPARGDDDVYAVGCLLYEALTGQAPGAGGARTRELLPTLSLHVERVINRALAQDPTQRFASPREMRAALVTRSGLVSPALRSSGSEITSPTIKATRPPPRLLRSVTAVGSLLAVCYGLWALSTMTLGGREPASAPSEARAAAGGAASAPAEGGQTASAPSEGGQTASAGAGAPLLHGLQVQGGVGALVELALVVDLETPYAAPPVFARLTDELARRYGDNLRVVHVLGGAHEDAGAALRARAALAAAAQSRYAAYSARLWRAPLARDAAALLALADHAGLDVERFGEALLRSGASALSAARARHLETARVLGGGALAPAGAAYVNGQRVRPATERAPALLSAAALTAAIDRELDAVQGALAAGVAQEAVSLARTQAALTRAAASPEAPGPMATEALYGRPWAVVEGDGLPARGLAGAPLSVTLHVDLSRTQDRAALEAAAAFQKAHPDTTRLLIKLAPRLDSQESFDVALALLGAHAEGGFWPAVAALEALTAGEGLEAGADPEASADPEAGAGPAQEARRASRDLLRSRALAQSREAALIAPTPFAVVGGHVVDADPALLGQVLQAHHALIEQMTAAGLAAEEVEALLTARTQALRPPEPAPPRPWRVRGWRMLPRLGALAGTRGAAGGAPGAVALWAFDPGAPGWRRQRALVERLLRHFEGSLTVYLVPPDEASAERLRPLFERWAQAGPRQILDDLEALARDAPGDALDAGLVERVEALAPLRVREPDLSRAVMPSLPGLLGVVARSWPLARAPAGALIIGALAPGERWIEGWVLAPGLAFEPCWEATRRALRLR